MTQKQTSSSGTKRMLVRRIRVALGISEKEASALVGAFGRELAALLKAHGRVVVGGLGTFRVQETHGGRVKLPGATEFHEYPAKRVVRVRPDAAFRARVFGG